MYINTISKTLSFPYTPAFSHLCPTVRPVLSICEVLPTEPTAPHPARGWKVANYPTIICHFIPVVQLLFCGISSSTWAVFCAVPGTAHLDSLQVPGFLSSSVPLPSWHGCCSRTTLTCSFPSCAQCHMIAPCCCGICPLWDLQDLKQCWSMSAQGCGIQICCVGCGNHKRYVKEKQWNSLKHIVICIFCLTHFLMFTFKLVN